MGKYDRQIQQAQLIGQGWMNKSEGFADEFSVMKKNNMKWEKDTLTTLQKQIQTNQHTDPTTAKAIAGEVDTTRENLKEFRIEAKRLFDEHENWALTEPRKSMAPIAKKLQLGAEGSEAYKAVAEACNRQLTEVAGVLKSTQRAYKDLTFALDAMDKRVAGIEAIVVQGQGKSTVWIKQVKAQAKQFSEYCANELANFKHQPDFIAKLRAGDFDGWAPTQVKQQLQLAEARAAQVPGIIAQIEKNHGRIVKSVPAEFMSGFMTSSDRQAMEKVKSDTILGFKTRQKFWAMVVAEMKKHKPYAGKL
jgi:hypothetical protein